MVMRLDWNIDSMDSSPDGNYVTWEDYQFVLQVLRSTFRCIDVSQKEAEKEFPEVLVLLADLEEIE